MVVDDVFKLVDEELQLMSSAMLPINNWDVRTIIRMSKLIIRMSEI